MTRRALFATRLYAVNRVEFERDYVLTMRNQGYSLARRNGAEVALVALCHEAPATVAVSSQINDGVRLYSTTLTAYLEHEPEGIDWNDVVMVCEYTDGGRVLLGGWKRPRLAVTTQRSYSREAKDSQLLKLTAKITDVQAPRPLTFDDGGGANAKFDLHYTLLEYGGKFVRWAGKWLRPS